ncbi:MAG: M23 family metallopeptidase, partial [Flavobacteriales bacterium]|nr:M23 family metallopeptidase [Flavobacteriales bacterium]
MPKNIKYYFDPITLSYKKVKIGFLSKVKKSIIWFVTTGALWVALYFTIVHFIPTPKELALMREIENMTINYDLLQRQLSENEERLAEVENRDDNLYRVIFESDPYSSTKRSGSINPDSYFDQMRGYNYSDIIINATKKMEELTKRIYSESKSLDEVASLALKKEEMLRSMPAIPPVTIDVMRRANLSSYGMRMHPISKIWTMHYGMDFSARIGTPIYATGDGRVIFAGRDNSGYGMYVVIDHGFGYKTLYGHMSKILTSKGKKVVR